MLLHSVNARMALAVRAFGLLLIGWTVFASSPSPGTSGRGLVITLMFAAATLGWVIWTWRAHTGRPASLELFAMAAAGGLLVAAAPSAAGSAFAFVAIVTGGFRLEFTRALAVTAAGLFTLALGVLLYDQAAVEVLAYGLGFVASLMAGANGRQAVVRADDAELLLAQVQRSREEQLRSARLEESARIAREIHDVLAHALAGLTIQLEATSSLVQGGADRTVILDRLRHAHSLAREGLEETRRAVGVLRSEGLKVPEALDALVAEYGASSPGSDATLTVSGDPATLEGPASLAVVRVAQEALTNVRKHAPGAPVLVELAVDEPAQGALVLRVRNGRSPAADDDTSALSTSGGGYGLTGMRERADILGGSLAATQDGDGWLVELQLPPAGAERPSGSLPAGGR